MKLQPINQQTNSMQNFKSKNVNFQGIYRFVIPDSTQIITIHNLPRQESFVSNMNEIFNYIFRTLKESPNILINAPAELIARNPQTNHLYLHEDKFLSGSSGAINIFSGNHVKMYLDAQNNPKALKALFQKTPPKDNIFIVKNVFDAWAELTEILPKLGITDDGRKINPDFIDENIPDWINDFAHQMLNRKNSSN